MNTKDMIVGDLCQLFFDITGVLFIEANPQSPDADMLTEDEPGTPRPKGLYGSVEIVTVSEQGAGDYVEQVNEGDDLRVTISGPRLLQVSINTFRSGAFDLINRVYNALQRNSTNEYLTARLLGYSRRSEVRNVPIPTGGTLEERHQFDLFLFTVASDDEIVTAIESLTITAIGDDGTNILTYDIEVSEQ